MTRCTFCTATHHGLFLCPGHAARAGVHTAVFVVDEQDNMTVMVGGLGPGTICTDCKAWLTNNGCDLDMCSEHGNALFSLVDLGEWKVHGPTLATVDGGGPGA